MYNLAASYYVMDMHVDHIMITSSMGTYGGFPKLLMTIDMQVVDKIHYHMVHRRRCEAAKDEARSIPFWNADRKACPTPKLQASCFGVSVKLRHLYQSL
jgi:hypothetical protein